MCRRSAAPKTSDRTLALTRAHARVCIDARNILVRADAGCDFLGVARNHHGENRRWSTTGVPSWNNHRSKIVLPSMSEAA